MIEAKLRPDSKKIILVELDIGQQQSVWFNYAAGLWYVDFDAIYSRIDPAFLVGISAQTGIVTIGSVSSDGAQLLSVAAISTAQANELTFYFDPGDHALHVHLQEEDEPLLHRIIIGVVFGVANHAGIYNGTIYEGRVRSAPSIAKSKDPLFFGRVAFDGGWISIDNTDGFFDEAGENYDLFGNAARILCGFDDQQYSEFARAGQGMIQPVRIGQDLFEVQMKDQRSQLSKRAPTAVFDATTYPYLDPGNVGKSIPIVYGTVRRIPVICTNQAQGSPPSWSFKVADTTYHGLKAIDAVYVDGVAKTPTADLPNGTFTLATGDYASGKKVTADVRGYKDAGSNLIENALDIILDLLRNHQGISYLSAQFNQSEWTATRAQVPVVCYFGDEPIEIYRIIEEICSSARTAFIVGDDGKYTARKYSPNRVVSQVFTLEDLLDVPTVEYDPTEVLTSTMVGYSKNWDEDNYLYVHDAAQESTIFNKYKTYREKKFDTLLTTSADGQAFSNDALSIAGSVARKFTLRMKMQPLSREIMDFIQAPILRKRGTGLLGNVIAEIIRIEKDLVAAEIRLGCRIVSVIPATIYVQGGYWGDGYWGDEVYSRSELQEAG